jgi:hypothetical protein
VRAVALFVLLGSAIAFADPDPDAQRLLDEGTRLFTEDANHQAARDAFQHSYEREPSWRALNGIALTFQEQGRFVDALETYEKLQREFDAVLSVNQRSTVRGRYAALLAKVGVVEVTASQAAATITIDNLEIGTAPLTRQVRLLPGRHVVVATLAGHQTLTKVVEIAAGQKLPLALVLAPERVVIKVENTPMVRRFERTTPWIVGGAGLGLVVIGGVLHVLSARDFAAFDDSVGSGSGTPPMAVPGDAGLHDRAQIERGIAFGAYAIGGGALIASAVMLAINQPRPARARVRVDPAPTGVALTIRY